MNKKTNDTSCLSIRVLLLLVAMYAFNPSASAQEAAPGLLSSNPFNENEIMYRDSLLQHSIWKPVMYKDSSAQLAPKGTWLHRKIFNEHLLDIKKPGFRIRSDFILDAYIGKSRRYVQTPTMNTRGYEVSGSVGRNLYFETAAYENQGQFGGYIDSFIRKNGMVPGQAAYKNFGNGKGFDFSYSTSRIIYTPGKHFAFDLGFGKNFIGDGYRSLILSDWATSYPYFKTTFTTGKFQYNAMWSEYIADRNPVYANKEGYLRKWSQTFVLDWKATSKLSISIFETVMWSGQDSLRSNDLSPWVASPVMFLHGNKAPSGLSNNMMAGGNISYQLTLHTRLYGQLVLDQLAKSTSPDNRNAFQAGIRSTNALGIPHLSVLLEYNQARPYTYSSANLYTNFAHNNQSLAHPLGANFREGLAAVQYDYKKWQGRFTSFVARYGADSSNAVNYGNNVLKSTNQMSGANDVKTGNGLAATIFYASASIAYLINPSSNMRIETGFTFRNNKSDLFNYRDRIFYIGLRMSFRKINYEF